MALAEHVASVGLSRRGLLPHSADRPIRRGRQVSGCTAGWISVQVRGDCRVGRRAVDVRSPLPQTLYCLSIFGVIFQKKRKDVAGEYIFPTIEKNLRILQEIITLLRKLGLTISFFLKFL